MPPLPVAKLVPRVAGAAVKYERALQDGPGFTAYLLSYTNLRSAHKLYTLVAEPKFPRPAGGYPVVIANHGYVPDPRKYGITREGIDSRPGDYYRSVPQLYASRGFMVVMPDYRGHNTSQGFDYIDPQDGDSAAYYTEDVVALLTVLDEIEDADLDNVFMWSHSMGGIVAMRALLATDVVRASSFWSTMDLADLTPQLGDIGGPVMIHHAAGDQATDPANSERLADALDSIHHPHTYHVYESDDHFFDGEVRELAAVRDVEFFRAVSAVGAAP